VQHLNQANPISKGQNNTKDKIKGDQKLGTQGVLRADEGRILTFWEITPRR
jgi:hypothetical protein